MNRFCALLLSLLALSHGLSASSCRESISTGTQVSTGITAGVSEVLARVYDPQTGRFLSADPVIQDPNNLQCYNRYSYCTNNPLVFTDPTGYYFVASSYSTEGFVSSTEATNAVTNAFLANSRVQGVGKVIGATGEATAATALVAAPEPTGATKVAGVALGAHALDLAQTGLKQAITGEVQQTLSSQMTENAALALGASPQVATTVGALPDAAAAGASLATVGLAGGTQGAAVGTLEANSIRSGLSTEVNPQGAVASGGAALERTPTTVIGRTVTLQRLDAGEVSLLGRLPDRGSPRANWKQNSGVLRQEMNKKLPIGDKSPGDTNGAFLNAERNLLEDQGWTFDADTNLWNPPAD